MASSSVASRAAAVGKLPGAAEFIHLGAGTATIREVDDWLATAAEAHRLARGTLEVPSFGFCQRTADGERCVGLVVPSRDQIGRKFPLAMFLELPEVESATEGYLAGRASVQAFSALAALRAEGELDAFESALSAITVSESGAARVAFCDELANRLNGEAASFMGRLLGDPVVGRLRYAAYTLLSAVASAPRARADDQGPIVIECPIDSLDDVATWIAWLERGLQDAIAPGGAGLSVYWCDTPQPRMLVSLGAPAPRAASYLARAGDASGRLWPLTTDNDAALEQIQANETATKAVADSDLGTLDSLAAGLHPCLTGLRL